MSTIFTAIRALYRTLTDELPARIDALNASKAAGQKTLAMPRLYAHDMNAGGDLTVAGIWLKGTREAPDFTAGGEHLVTLTLELVIPGSARADDQTLDAVHRIIGAIRETLRAGDGRGPWMIGGSVEGANVVRCFPKAWQMPPHVWTLPLGGAAGMPFGRATPVFEIKVWNPDQ